jgi:type IV secretory pathway TrbL component
MSMELARTAIAGCAVATVVVGAATTGCGSDNKSSSPSSSASATGSSATPSSAQPSDYSNLLIKPSDIGGDVAAPQPPVLNPNGQAGVEQLFASPDNSRRIGDIILVAADAAAAKAGLDNTKNNYVSKVTGTWQPADVGSNGAIISEARTVLLFTEGKALVSLEFDSAPNDPIDPGVATDVGRKQDAAIKNGLPS